MSMKNLLILIFTVPLMAMFSPLNAQKQQSVRADFPELIDKRDMFSKHYDLGNNKFKAEISGGPIHYESKTGSWEDISTELQASSNGFALENTTNTLKSYFPNNLNGREGVEVFTKESSIRMGATFSFAYQAKLEKPASASNVVVDLKKASVRQLAPNVVKYDDNNPIGYVEYAIEKGMIKQQFILKQLPRGTYSKADILSMSETITLPEDWSIEADGEVIESAATVKGELVIINALGEEMGTIPVPVVFEKNDKSNMVDPTGEMKESYHVQKNGRFYKITLGIPMSWLAAEGRSFPIVIDPTLYIYGASGGYINENGAYSNDPNSVIMQHGSTEHRGWLKWNTSSIQDYFTITDVMIRFWQTSGEFTNYNNEVTDCTGTPGPYSSTSNISAAWNDLGNGRYMYFKSEESLNAVAINGYYGGKHNLASDNLQAALKYNYFQVGLKAANTSYSNPVYNYSATTARLTVGYGWNPQVTIHDQSYPSTTYCKNASSTPLRVTVSGQQSLDYIWYYNTSNSNNPVGATIASINTDFRPPTTTIGDRYYFCIVRAAHEHWNFATSPTFHVKVEESSLATVSENGHFCEGSTAQFTISGGANEVITYNFGGASLTTTLDNSGKKTITTSPITGSSITMNLTQARKGSCTPRALSSSATATVSTFNVNISGEIVGNVGVLQNNDTICNRESIKLSASGANSYTWTSNSLISNDSGETTYSSPTSTARYIVTGINTLGCMNKDTLNVIVRAPAIPPSLTEGFEANTLFPLWSLASSLHTTTILSNGSPEGSGHLRLTTTGNAYHNSGITREFTPKAISECSWRMKTSSEIHCGYFALLQGTANSGAFLFVANFKPGGLEFLGDGQSFDFSAPINTWYHIELKNWNWTSKTFDIYIDGTLRRANFKFSHSTNSLAGRIGIYNISPSTSFFDDILIFSPSSDDPAITVNPSSALCEGDLVSLGVSGTAVNNAVWSGGIVNNTPFTIHSNATYSVIAEDAYGCELMNESITLAVNPSPIISVTPTSVEACENSSVVLSASGALTYSWMPGSSTGDSLLLPAVIGSGTYVVSGTDSNGCVGTATANISIPATEELSLATSGNWTSVPGIHIDSFFQPNDGLEYSYYDSNCGLIASVQESSGGTSLGMVSCAVTVESTTPVSQGQPYVGRWYEIVPSNQGPATVTLYFTDEDFINYNANNGDFPDLATNAYDETMTTNLVISKISEGDLGVGTATEINATAVWDYETDRWELSFPVSGFSQFYVFSQDAGTSLPVDLNSFTVQKLRTSVLAEWTTLSETNSSHFNVQRSSNSLDFETLGRVNSNATNSSSKLDYSFLDPNPLTGNNYYRLEQVDLDGTKTYSDLKNIFWTSNGIISIYPNPTKDQLNIDFSSEKVSQTEIKLFDMRGRLLKSKMIESHLGINQINLSMDELASGMYHIQLLENNVSIYNGKVTKE